MALSVTRLPLSSFEFTCAVDSGRIVPTECRWKYVCMCSKCSFVSTGNCGGSSVAERQII